MEINKVQTSFGMAIKIKPSQENEVLQYIEKLPYEQRVKISLIKHEQKSNPIDVELSILPKRLFRKERLRATVNGKIYTQGFIHNATDTIKKAVSDADKILQKQLNYSA